MMGDDQHDLHGTTLNERLYLRDLLDEFDQAVEDRDRERLIEILERVEICGADAEKTADDVLKQR